VMRPSLMESSVEDRANIEKDNSPSIPKDARKTKRRGNQKRRTSPSAKKLGQKGAGGSGKGASPKSFPSGVRAQHVENESTGQEQNDDKSVAFWIQKVRTLQEDVRRAQLLAQTYDTELQEYKTKMMVAEVQFATKMQEMKREQYESLVRENMETEQRVSIEYEKKIDQAYMEMEKSYNETVESDARKMHQQISENEKLRHELGQLRARNNELAKKNQLLLKELSAKTSDRSNKFREESLADAQKTVDYHRQVSQEAVAQAREQRRMLQLETIKGKNSMEEQSSRFEHQLHSATVKAIERYRKMAREAMDTAADERKKLREAMNEKEHETTQQRTEFEERMDTELTKRLNAYKEDVIRLEKETSQIREHYDTLVQEILTQIQQEAIIFENETKRKAMNVVEYYKKQAEETKKSLESERQLNLRRQMRLIDEHGGGDGDQYSTSPGKKAGSISSPYFQRGGGSMRVPRSSRNVAVQDAPKPSSLTVAAPARRV